MQAEQHKSRLTLKEVSEAFDQWRGSRTSREPIPKRLWQLTRRLKSGYQLSHIYASLGVNSAQFHQHVMRSSKKSSASTDNKKDQPAVFVELSQTSLANKKQPQALQVATPPSRTSVTITRQDGACLELTDLEKNEFKQTLELFLRNT